MNRGSSMNERVIVIRYEYDCFEDRCFDQNFSSNFEIYQVGELTC